MPANSSAPADLVPESAMRAAVLQRRIGASIERIWENVLDWEHLPFVHCSSFQSIELLQSADWGWRARATSTGRPDEELLIEVMIARDASRYCSRTLEGSGAGTEIWTTLTPVGRCLTDIEVEFWVPEVPRASLGAIGDAYLALYTRLWDEDENMMQAREEALGLRRAREETRATTPDRIDLGPRSALIARLPLRVEAHGHPYCIVLIDGALVAHSAVCPHLLGPLDDDRSSEFPPGEIECPWHGYRFDARTGQSCDGRRLRLAPAPVVVEDRATSNVTLCWDD
jgi:nitrite reductase/ring-hydroxylating ferredoxin subunit